MRRRTVLHHVLVAGKRVFRAGCEAGCTCHLARLGLVSRNQRCSLSHRLQDPSVLPID